MEWFDTSTQDVGAAAITIEQFAALKEMSFWLVPDGVPAEARTVEAYQPQVVIGDLLSGEEPAVRDVSVCWAGNSKAESLTISIAVGGLHRRGRHAKYSFMARPDEVTGARIEQNIHTTDGSEYYVHRPMEKRDIPGLVMSLVEISEVVTAEAPNI